MAVRTMHRSGGPTEYNLLLPADPARRDPATEARGVLFLGGVVCDRATRHVYTPTHVTRARVASLPRTQCYTVTPGCWQFPLTYARLKQDLSSVEIHPSIQTRPCTSVLNLCWTGIGRINVFSARGRGFVQSPNRNGWHRSWIAL